MFRTTLNYQSIVNKVIWTPGTPIPRVPSVIYVEPKNRYAFCRDIINAYNNNRPYVIHEMLSDSYTRLFFDIDSGDDTLDIKMIIDSLNNILNVFMHMPIFKGIIDPTNPQYSISYSTTKTSIHVIFKNVLFKTNEVNTVRKILESITIKNSNIVSLRLIDTAPYNSNGSLRLPYCCKSVQDDSIHLMYDSEKCDKVSRLVDYILGWPSTTCPEIHDGSNIPIHIISTDKWPMFTPKTYENHFGNVFYNIPQDQKWSSLTNALRELMEEYGVSTEPKFGGNQDLILGRRIQFTIVEPGGYCPFCKKKKGINIAHKKGFVIVCCPTGFMVIKEGNSKKCGLSTYISFYELVGYKEYIIEIVREYHKRYIISANGIVYCYDGIMWRPRLDKSNNNIGIIILSMCGCRVKEKTLSYVSSALDRVIPWTSPYTNVPLNNGSCIIPYINGGYNIETNEFIQNHNYFVPNNLGIMYLDFERNYPQVSVGYQKIKSIVNRIIDSIIPQDSKYRKGLEIVLSSGLIGKHKPRIYFFLGSTSSGKSTLRIMCEKAFGPLYHGCSASSLFAPIMNTAHPSPDIAAMGGKRVVFGSESQQGLHIESSVIKFLTESTFKARELYSNSTTHQNVATIIVDTNHMPRMATEDTAIFKRFQSIMFDRFFVGIQEVERRKELGVGRIAEMADDSILQLFDTKGFVYAFLSILTEWYNKHYVENKSADRLVWENYVPKGKALQLLQIIFEKTSVLHAEVVTKEAYDINEDGYHYPNQEYAALRLGEAGCFMSPSAFSDTYAEFKTIMDEYKNQFHFLYYKDTPKPDPTKAKMLENKITQIHGHIEHDSSNTRDGDSVIKFINEGIIDPIFDSTDPDIIQYENFITQQSIEFNDMVRDRIIQTGFSHQS